MTDTLLPTAREAAEALDEFFRFNSDLDLPRTLATGLVRSVIANSSIDELSAIVAELDRYWFREPLTSIPSEPIPEGRKVVHRDVRPHDFHADYPLGHNGFRAWTIPADMDFERCDCEWGAGRLAEHYKAWSDT